MEGDIAGESVMGDSLENLVTLKVEGQKVKR